MKLIAGLGNPGPRYAETRHNVGYDVADELARRWRCDLSRFDRDFEGLVGEAQVGTERVLLLKPLTFMNLSGRSVAAVCRFYRLPPTEVLVVHDDLDLPVGQLRLRASGSAGGQKGLADILRHFGTQEVARLRIGIGKALRAPASDFVLSRFLPDERPVIDATVALAAEAAEAWVRRGIATAMNEFNRRRDEERGSSPAGGASEGESS
ncbi:MAG: aminoacyl-tRNA hydrolase [Phycisphaerales bacterium]|nr:aminoacyl-tRNA hydrolase [Phycisphaerales bacterium]